ncbi:MAG: DUF853 family protein [Sphingomonadales bacterium]|nr:DUF853 family protein [Sphingomonadales bacterium]
MVDDGIFIGTGGGNRQVLNLKRANRHGLIAGATGTGKTVTLQGIVEGLSAVGVPSFVADVKGDLSGLCMAGSATSKIHEVFAARATEIGQADWAYRDNPVQFWDLFGEQGHPIRTTVSEMGPLLLARLMDLNEVQEGVLTIAFHVADKDGLLLLDLDDLQAMLVNCGNRAEELTLTYGNISKQSVGTIQRSLLQLRSQGGDHFFGEPALDLEDFIKCDDSGRGIINILAADKLMASPKLYSTFLLWLLSELFETLPEIGDPDKPKLYPKIDVTTAITELKVGEALVSLLQPDGAPSPVERTLIKAPASRVGPATPQERAVMIQTDAIGAKYDTLIDRESAEEILASKQAEAAAAAAAQSAQAEADKQEAIAAKEQARQQVILDREAARQAREAERAAAAKAREDAKPSFAEKMVESAARSAATSVGRKIAGQLGGQLLRGLLGGLFKGR